MLKEEIISQRDALISRVTAKTSLTQEQHHESEANVIKRVFGKEENTVKSSWVVGSGPVLKKKDRVVLALA